MTNNVSKLTKELSRRTVLRAAAAVGSVPALVLAAGPASAKMSQAGIAYRNSPKESASCSNCKLFIAPSSCKSVDGEVSANGWCKIWLKA